MLIAIVFILFLSFLSFKETYCLSTIGIDFGCDMIKIGISKPSMRIIIAKDEFGEKLIPTAIYIKEDHILFGQSALNKWIRDPENVYLHLPCLIGKNLDEESIKNYMNQFPYYNLREDSLTGSLYFVDKRNQSYFVEEMIALILDHAIKLANDNIEKMYPNLFHYDIPFNPRSAVIAVPSYYQQKERKILLDICKIANISVLQLFDSNTASFVTLISTYLKRELKDGIYGLLDIGAENIQMSIAHIKKLRSTFRTIPFESAKFNVISSSKQSNLGVHTVLRKMHQHFISVIRSTSPIEYMVDTKCPKFVFKIYIACRELLQLLKSSESAHVTIKGLFGNQDYIISMNYTTMSNIVDETLVGISKVIKRTFLNIPGFWIIPKGVVVVGGGKYLPFADDAIKRALKKVPYMKVLDSFFNVAWGSVNRATDVTPGIFNFPVTIPENSFEFIKIRIMINETFKEMEINFQQYRQIKRSTKLLRNLRDNFKLSTYYRPISVSGIFTKQSMISDYVSVLDVVVHNLNETINNFLLISKSDDVQGKSNPHYSYKGVEIIHSIDINSIISLESVKAVFVKKTILDIENLSEEEDLMNTSTKVQINEVKLELVFSPLKITVNEPYRSLPTKQLDQMIEKTSNTKWKTEEYFQKEAVINELDFFITETKRKFNEKDYIISTSDIERRMIWSFLDDTTRWMKNVASNLINKEEYFHKFDRLINMTSKIDVRVHETRNRPILIKKLQTLLESTQHFIMNMYVTSSKGKLSKGIFTKNETNDLRALNKETRIWFSNFTSQFNNIKPENDPPILCDEIIEKIVTLEGQHKILLELMDKRMDPGERQDSSTDKSLIENSSKESSCNDTTSDTCSVKDKADNASTKDATDNKSTIMSDNATDPNVGNVPTTQCITSEKETEQCSENENLTEVSNDSL